MGRCDREGFDGERRRLPGHRQHVLSLQGGPGREPVQPEQDGFALAPGRYIVVIKGMGFAVAGDVTDPDQCVERINAANGAFYSP